MIHTLMILTLPAVICASSPSADRFALEGAPMAAALVPVPDVDSLEAAYKSGQTWNDFFDGVDRRRQLWRENWANAKVPAELAARAKAAGPWRILVITEPGCSDSVNSVPYIAKLVEETPGLELRLVNSTVGRPWMEAHRTADGRPATPTILVLDEAYRIRGCWIEQPVALQSFWLPIVAQGIMSEKVGEKMAWYARDEGRETLREFVEVLEGAHAGNVVCPGSN